jgi:hypothetical protein
MGTEVAHTPRLRRDWQLLPIGYGMALVAEL